MITVLGKKKAGRCVGCPLVCLSFVVSHFTTLPQSAIFDCGTPWISFHSFLLKSFGHSLNVLIFDDCSQKKT